MEFHCLFIVKKKVNENATLKCRVGNVKKYINLGTLIFLLMRPRASKIMFANKILGRKCLETIFLK